MVLYLLLNLFAYITPSHGLLWGHEEVVRLLLGREDINPDMPSSSDQTPLLWAVQQGHEGVVKLLLGRKDVSPDYAEIYYGRTPLRWGARRNCETALRKERCQS